MTDSEFFLALVCVSCVVTLGFACLLAGWRGQWSDRKVRLIAAFPIPGLLMGLTAFMAGHALVTSIFDPEACGVDACGMGMMVGTMGFGAGLAAYIIALLPAWMGVRLAR